MRNLVSTTFGTSTHSRASTIPAFTPAIAPREMSTFSNACFIPSLTLTLRMGAVVWPPMIRLMSVPPSFKPLINGIPRSGTLTVPRTIPFAPTPR